MTVYYVYQSRLIRRSSRAGASTLDSSRHSKGDISRLEHDLMAQRTIEPWIAYQGRRGTPVCRQVRMTPSSPFRATTIPPATDVGDSTLPRLVEPLQKKPLRHNPRKLSMPSMPIPHSQRNCIGPASSRAMVHVGKCPTGESCSLYPMRLKVPQRSLRRV